MSRSKSGEQVEQEADQAEGCFSAVEGLEAKAVGAKVLRQFLQSVPTVGSAQGVLSKEISIQSPKSRVLSAFSNNSRAHRVRELFCRALCS